MWWVYALLSAFFAAVTAIMAKVGVKDVIPTWRRRFAPLSFC
jgi:uncharacterized membrane protein